MRLLVALFLGRQIDAYVGDVGTFPQEVMTNHAVEVHGRGLADVYLVVADFGLAGQVRAQLSCHRVGPVECRALGHVDNDLKLILVVIGQHLERHRPKYGQCHRRGQQCRHAGQYHPGDRASVDDGSEHSFGRLVDRPLGQIVRLFASRSFDQATQRHHRHPRREHKGDHGGDRHGQRYIERQRGHVRPHHARDEHQRQKAGNDRQGRKNQRRADFLNGAQHRLARGQNSHAEVACDILHIGDGIVDEQAKREDQGKHRHAVDRIARQQVDEQRQAVTDRNRQRDDECRAPTDHQADERDDGDHGHHETLDQFVHLFIGGLAVVARDAVMDAARKMCPGEFFEPLLHRFGNPYGVRALSLGHGEMDGRVDVAAEILRFVGWPKSDPTVIFHLGRAIDDVGDVF